MSEPIAGAIVPAGTVIPAVPYAAPDQRAYVAWLAHFKSPEARRTMVPCLEWIAALLGRESAAEVPWHALRYEHTSVIAGLIMEQAWSPSHRNKHLSALRGVIKQAWKLGLITSDERDRACDVESDKAKRLLAGRDIGADEVAGLLGACEADENQVLGIRDAALLTVLYRTGVRRAEAASLLIENYDSRGRGMKVTGKGDKERKVIVPRAAAPPLDRWLAVVGSRRGPIFRPVDQWGNIASRHLSTRAVGLVVSQRQAEAGIRPLSTHDFRRTFIGDFLDAAGDLAQAQKLAGHSSATTTAAYDRRPEEALRDAVDKLTMPAPQPRQPEPARADGAVRSRRRPGRSAPTPQLCGS